MPKTRTLAQQMVAGQLIPPNFGNEAIDVEKDLSPAERIGILCDERNEVLAVASRKLHEHSIEMWHVRHGLQKRFERLCRWILK